jgi:hypothetical protein
MVDSIVMSERSLNDIDLHLSGYPISRLDCPMAFWDSPGKYLSRTFLLIFPDDDTSCFSTEITIHSF